MTQSLPLLLETQALFEQLDNPHLLIVQLTHREVYAQHHIPGAVLLEPGLLLSGNNPAKGSVPDRDTLTNVLRSIGFDGSQHIIAYDDEGGGWAGRLIWTLDYIGHQQYSYLNGGLHAWAGDQLPLQNGPPQTIQPSNYSITNINEQVRAQASDIVQQLNTEQMVIWDARSPAEYNGSKAFAQRGGHIPGAINLEWTELMDKNNHLRLLPLEQIQQRLNQIGIQANKHIVTHCHSHHRSGLTYLVAKILGYANIRGYDGSWSEWGNSTELPVET